MVARLDEDGRCRLTECWPAECGCKDHRGGTTPEEEATLPVDKPITGVWLSPPFEAKYHGRCVACGSPFSSGVTVRYDQDHELVAECCLELADRHPRGGYWTEGF